MSLAFQLGQVVDVRGHGRAEIIDVGAALDPGSKFHGRVQVRYVEDGTTFWANPSKLRPMKPAGKQVVVAFRTEEYRQAVVHNVDMTHTCVEIGCHEGVTTRIIHNRSRSVVGIDIGAKVVEVAHKRSPHIQFEVMDGMDLKAVMALSPTGSYDRILIDISGQAGLHLAVPMVQLYRQALPDALIIIKNRALHREVDAWERRQQQQQLGEGKSHGGDLGAGGQGGGASGEGREEVAADGGAAAGGAESTGEEGDVVRPPGCGGGQAEAAGGAGDDEADSCSSDGSDASEGAVDRGVEGSSAGGAGVVDPGELQVLLHHCETFRHRSASHYKTSERAKQREAERREWSKQRKLDRRMAKLALKEQQQQQAEVPQAAEKQ